MSKDKKKKSGKASGGKASGGKASGGKSGKIAIVVSRFNSEVTTGLLNGAISELVKSGRDKNDVRVVECPGAFEIPLVVKELCRSGKYCGIICLGAVIKGETAHFEYISYAVTKGIASLTLEFEIPITFGVLTCYNDEQAVKRSQDNAENKGAEAAKSVIEMIDILNTI